MMPAEMEIARGSGSRAEVVGEISLEFRRGLFGFEGLTRFLLLPHREGSPLSVLQAVDEPSVAFVVMDPFILCPVYRFAIPMEDMRVLQCSEQAELTVLAIVGIPDDPREMTLNLQGPIVLNITKQLGCQLLLPGEQYSARHSVADAMELLREASGRGG